MIPQINIRIVSLTSADAADECINFLEVEDNDGAIRNLYWRNIIMEYVYGICGIHNDESQVYEIHKVFGPYRANRRSAVIQLQTKGD